MAKEEGRKKKGAGPAGREAVIPPAETDSVGSRDRLLQSQRLRVLTQWREAPSRACISAALTAGIAAAPLTHAGSRDTAAPC